MILVTESDILCLKNVTLL